MQLIISLLTLTGSMNAKIWMLGFFTGLLEGFLIPLYCLISMLTACMSSFKKSEFILDLNQTKAVVYSKYEAKLMTPLSVGFSGPGNFVRR
jgi:hypothetical protein